jgi:cell division protein ZapE
MSVLQRYRSRVTEGALTYDAAQEAAAGRLEHVAAELKSWRPGLFSRRTPPRGLYLWGDVGRGKSMLMDLFFDSVALPGKRRVHFNAFMAEVHAALHVVRRSHVRDPIPEVARRMQSGLLCFDELQVEDVADAMILGRLFEQLFARHCVVVATSNSAPDRLYQHGLNRQLFLPFIALIKQRMEVVSLMGHDWRRGHASRTYHTGPDADGAMDAAWKALGGDHERRDILPVLGRMLQIARSIPGAARFTFPELCEQPLGPADYLVLAESYRTILIDHIPVMGPSDRDATRRFTLLIDTLYDKGVRLVCSAAAGPDLLYQGEEASFQRTVSRLHEMGSDAYIQKR